jgi:hypothetical protein
MKKDELSQFITLRSTIGGIAGCFTIPITFVIWATWFTQADAMANFLLLLVAAAITFVVAFFAWLRMTS